MFTVAFAAMVRNTTVLSSEGKRPERETDNLHNHVISGLRMHGVLPPLASVARWVGTGEALPLRLLKDF